MIGVIGSSVESSEGWWAQRRAGRTKSLRNGVHHANAVFMGTSVNANAPDAPPGGAGRTARSATWRRARARGAARARASRSTGPRGPDRSGASATAASTSRPTRRRNRRRRRRGGTTAEDVSGDARGARPRRRLSTRSAPQFMARVWTIRTPPVFAPLDSSCAGCWGWGSGATRRDEMEMMSAPETGRERTIMAVTKV